MTQKQKYFLYFASSTLYLLLIFGFLIGEDLNGGAKGDFYEYLETANLFANDFSNTFFNYDERNDRHSPVIIIIISQFIKLGFSENLLRFIGLNICILNILFFYKCIKIKFKFVDSFYLQLLSLVILLSPTFRALSIWPDSRIYGLLFFLISVYYFLKFDLEKKQFSFIILNSFFLAVASYFSPNFAVFSIYFFISYVSFYGLSKQLLTYIFFNFLLAYPAFHYLFISDVFFLSSSSTPASQHYSNSFFSLENFSNKFIIILSIIFFYYSPIIFSQKIKDVLSINIKNNIHYLVIILLIYLINIFYFNYKIQFTGGGIFFLASNFLFGNNILLFLVTILSFYIFLIRLNNFNNLLIIFLLLLSNPQYTIYHKYYDPILLFLFFTIFKFEIKKEYFCIKNISYIYIFYLLFITLSIIKIYYI